MSSTNGGDGAPTPGPGQAPGGPGPQLNVLAQYTKDLSFDFPFEVAIHLQDVGGPFRWITNRFGKTAEQAADTPLWLATAAETAAVTGKLWAQRKELPTPGMGSDMEARHRLWAECSRLAGWDGVHK